MLSTMRFAHAALMWCQARKVSHILRAMLHIEKAASAALDEVVGGANRIKQVGDALEAYVKSAFAGTLEESDAELIAEKHEKVFSYAGNANNIPDAMIQGGDAIEVKKIESFNSGIPLNSSYPKDKLYADDHRVNNACRTSETWDSKDMIYAIGVVQGRKVQHLWLIDGACYAAERDTYARIEQTISDGVNSIPDVEFSKSKELGRVNKVDPLGITYLRIRGMWHIENPSKVFHSVYTIDKACNSSVAAILRKEKYDSFSSADRSAVENNPNINVKDIKVANPNNPVKRLDAVLITLYKA